MKVTRLAILILSLLIGIPVGTGVFVAYYAEALSYLSDDPRACINCHVMGTQFRSWQRSSHHTVATCNSCHSPGSILEKYWSKAVNGYHHSLAFTTGNYHDPIQIKEPNLQRVQRSCLTCHQSILENSWIHKSRSTTCLSCHSEVGHRK